MVENGSVFAGVVSGGISQVKDTALYVKGEINGHKFAVQTTQNVTGAVGVITGVEYGAVLGSALLPGVGTLVGAIAGAMIGERFGRLIGSQAGHLVFGRMAESGNRILQEAKE